MPEQHRALDWLARRRDGESIALIASRAGVSEQAVKRATKDYGPFPRPTRQVRRVHVSDDIANARTRRWVEARRRGARVADLARAEGLSHQLVSRATVDYGPYPSPEVVEKWVEARRAGQTLASIAERDQIRPSTVRQATRRCGPFPMPGPTLPDGVLGVKGVARRMKVSETAVVRWVKAGFVPAPDFVTSLDRSVWLATTIERWLGQTTDLMTCPKCGARCVSLARHEGAAHAAT